MELIAIMIEEEIDGDIPEGSEPLFDPEMFVYPRIEEEYPLFSELEPGDV